MDITDLNNQYLRRGELRVEIMGRGMAWSDTGTHESLLQASGYVYAIEECQGLKIGCPEEISFAAGRITSDQLRHRAEPIKKNAYGQCLPGLLNS